MTDPAQDALPLPGLDQPRRPPQPLELAIRRTIADLQAKDLLTEAHAADLAIMLELAEVVAIAKAAKKVSTISNDLRLLWEIKNSFVLLEGEADDKLRDAMAAFNAALDDQAQASP